MKKKKIIANSTSLFYSAVRFSKDINSICFRLGLNPKKLLSDIKNYLEKTEKRETNVGVAFSDDFQKTIELAIKISIDRGRNSIGENEILAALAEQDEFFKKTLIDYDLKPEDVKNLTLWLDSAEDLNEKNKKFWTQENLLRAGSLGKDFSTGYTLTLDSYSTDWRKVVSKWKYREIIGHEKEIGETEVILAKSSMANVLIVGDAGTGRKSIIEALAQKCYLGSSLPELNNKRVVELDAVLIGSANSRF